MHGDLPVKEDPSSYSGYRSIALGCEVVDVEQARTVIVV